VLTRVVVCLLLVFVLPGCGSKPRAPVEDRNARTASSSSAYTVQRGDTLYSIAFRYGMDYRKMAAANRIPSPYTIYPGQRIHLKEAELVPKRVKEAPVSTAGSTSSPAPRPAATGTAAPATSKSSSSSRTTPTAVTKPSSSTAKKNPPATQSAPARTVAGWRWPTTGRIVRGYSSSVHKGIDIAGNRGDPVYAVAHGTVVYAGAGIVGMGELVIVKHNDIYLSAYAHNDRLLVGEGERVRAGQKIATKGNSGTDEVKLHFEIRKEGKPVDPKKLLPRR
jgi:lipoprotein NlpD